MLPPPAIITRRTGLSMRRSSAITTRTSRSAARKNTSSPGWIIVSPSTRTLASLRNIATMRVSTFGMCRRRSLIGCETSGPPA
jgi:hypothetical protein